MTFADQFSNLCLSCVCCLGGVLSCLYCLAFSCLLPCLVLHCLVSSCLVMTWIILYCIALYCLALPCIVLHSPCLVRWWSCDWPVLPCLLSLIPPINCPQLNGREFDRRRSALATMMAMPAQVRALSLFWMEMSICLSIFCLSFWIEKTNLYVSSVSLSCLTFFPFHPPMWLCKLLCVFVSKKPPFFL